jgi:hypothetical protein
MPIPAENSMANQLMVENSGFASGPPRRMLPNLPARRTSTNTSTIFTVQIKKNPAYLDMAVCICWKISPRYCWKNIVAATKIIIRAAEMKNTWGWISR